MLMQEYGANGDKAAFEMARTGAQGGLYAVLKKIAEQMVKEYTGNEVSARIHHFWNGHTMEEQFLVMNEYINKFGHLLPTELTESTAIRIKVNFIKVLQEHPQLIKRIRNIRNE